MPEGAGLYPGAENFPDFMDVWSQHFRDIPCALTVVPAKDYASTEGSLHFPIDKPLPKALVKKLIAVRLSQVQPKQ